MIKKTVLACVFAFPLLGAAPQTTETKVFVCKSKDAIRYHYKKDCRGLSGCELGVAEITLAKAKKLKRTLCKWEEK